MTGISGFTGHLFRDESRWEGFSTEQYRFTLLHAPRGLLEFHADPESPVYNDDFVQGRPIILYCGTGGRSALAAKTLHDMGYPDVASLAGGYQAWRLAES